jgi:REP element-mobilizing transposase RayT
LRSEKKTFEGDFCLTQPEVLDPEVSDRRGRAYHPRVAAIFRLRNGNREMMMGKMILERKHRLPVELYLGLNVVSITACVKNMASFFTTQDRFATCEEILLTALNQSECGAEVYLFMPDHTHLLLRGESKSAAVLQAMRSFKQKTGFWLSRSHSPVRWQKDFYDHILRKHEAIRKHILYILNNPVRKGLVENWQDYPFKGSTIHDLDEWDSV